MFWQRQISNPPLQAVALRCTEIQKTKSTKDRNQTIDVLPHLITVKTMSLTLPNRYISRRNNSRHKFLLCRLALWTASLTSAAAATTWTHHNDKQNRKRPLHRTLRNRGRKLSQDVQCFEDATDAAVLGTEILTAFWHDIVYTTDCDPVQIAAVYDIYFRPNLLVQDLVGNSLSTSLDEYKAVSIGDGTQPNTATYICEYQDFSLEATQEAFTEPGIYHDFVWIGNQIISDEDSGQGDTVQPRQYFIEFAHVPQQGTSSDQKTTKAASGKGGKTHRATTRPCQQPQIYTIVEL